MTPEWCHEIELVISWIVMIFTFYVRDPRDSVALQAKPVQKDHW